METSSELFDWLALLSLQELISMAAIIGFFGFAIYAGFSLYYGKRRCPKCRSFIRTKTVSKDSLGEHFGNASYQEFRQFLKCDNCGHIWHIINREDYS